MENFSARWMKDGGEACFLTNAADYKRTRIIS